MFHLRRAGRWSFIVSEIIAWEVKHQNEIEQAKAQVKKGEVRNPDGRKGKEMAHTKSCEPLKRDAKKMHASSTAGKVAKAARGIDLKKD